MLDWFNNNNYNHDKKFYQRFTIFMATNKDIGGFNFFSLCYLPFGLRFKNSLHIISILFWLTFHQTKTQQILHIETKSRIAKRWQWTGLPIYISHQFNVNNHNTTYHSLRSIFKIIFHENISICCKNTNMDILL